jgi:hypothetical protein
MIKDNIKVLSRKIALNSNCDKVQCSI